MPIDNEYRSAVVRLLREFSDGGLYGEFSDWCHSCGPGKLADLIEPEPERTCCMERVEWHDIIGDHEIKRHKIVCSHCGLELEADLTPRVKYPYRYCPRCGAKAAGE